MDIPSTMRSWQYSSTQGGLENNLTLDIVPLPQPKADQHLVRIIAAAVNPVDYRLAEFQLLHKTTFPKPASPGNEFAGYIVKPAPRSALKAGQLVCGAAGTTFMCGGAMSEYGIANVNAVIPMPAGLSTTDAAGISTVGITAYQSIIPNSKPGSRVFLNGGSGGVGTFGIQIAKAEGRHVTVTCSTPNVELCKSLGADEVIDYKTQNVLQALKASPHKYDLVVDNVESDHSLYWHAHEYTNPGAKYVTVAVSHHLSFVWFIAKARLLPGFLGGAKRQHVIVIGAPNMEHLKKIADWMVEGKIKSVIDSKYKFEEVKQAYQRLKTGRARGKIIVLVAPEEERTA
jgi:NADPH:quinone reductase-like Zn-dependent oxidoreductase